MSDIERFTAVASDPRVVAAIKEHDEAIRQQVEVEFDETLNEIVAHAPEEFDGDEAINCIAVKYVRWLEGLVTGQSDPAEVCRVLREQIESELEATEHG